MARKAKQPPLVARYSDMGKFWYLAYPRSYQPAYRRDYNQFETREAAVAAAKERGHPVEYHAGDAMQNDPGN